MTKVTKDTLAALGERGIITQFIRPLLYSERGNTPLDDCAILDVGAPRPLLLTTDQSPSKSFMELLGVGTPADLAHFHVTTNVSDIAAMGGHPFGMLLVLTLIPTDTAQYLQQYLDGVKQAMTDYNLSLLGGDTKQSKIRSTTITLIGYASSEGILRRQGAKCGDAVFVTGPPLGTSLLSFIECFRNPVDSAERRIRRPIAQVSFGQALAASGVCTSCMDMSDGLLASAEQLGDANGVTFHISVDNLPLAPSPSPHKSGRWRDLIVNVGGDFGLLFTTRVEDSHVAEKLGAFRVGSVRNRDHKGVNERELISAGIRLHPWEQFTTVEPITDEIRSIALEE